MSGEKDISPVFLSVIGQNIARKRKERGMTMEQLGLEIGLTRMQVNRIEKGYNITMITLLKVALALSVKPEELVKFNNRLKPEDLEKLVNNNKASRLRKKE